MTPPTLAAAIAACLVFLGPVAAHEFKASDLTIDHPSSRPTSPGAKVGVGYVSIRNDGSKADRLIGGSATVAGRFEIHASSVEDGVARMRRVDDGIVVEPGATVKLASGGVHVMLLDLKQQIVKGQSFDGTLAFERAGTVPVRFMVEGFGAAAAAASHKKHKP
ncbi:copper chaperone PCu(A)C [Jiella pacifica]|uniref:Copper chaperone PCu(A)C n=1 Tax=Jiella pacifica TaxID=2696469 RepID=A0A6N9T8M5_9HYPH|nr:copper chaperone PCu(A)C [Jiella pacifica]NDW07650.1 copper chaperone PCu(A)C [Jiella pacifica]